jgi:hypothetical protein
MRRSLDETPQFFTLARFSGIKSKKNWLPTLNTLRNFFLMPATEKLSVFERYRSLPYRKQNRRLW